jgi:hypothetical protein
VGLAHNGKGQIKGKPLTFNMIVGSANRIANMHVITHFEYSLEDGYLDSLQIN